MKLSEALYTAETPKRGSACTVGELLADIRERDGEGEAAKVAAVIADRHRSAQALALVLRANGYLIRDYTIRRHRKGECSC